MKSVYVRQLRRMYASYPENPSKYYYKFYYYIQFKCLKIYHVFEIKSLYYVFSASLISFNKYTKKLQVISNFQTKFYDSEDELILKYKLMSSFNKFIINSKK